MKELIAEVAGITIYATFLLAGIGGAWFGFLATWAFLGWWGFITFPIFFFIGFMTFAIAEDCM